MHASVKTVNAHQDHVNVGNKYKHQIIEEHFVSLKEILFICIGNFSYVVV
jgi:hypothetical protein